MIGHRLGPYEVRDMMAVDIKTEPTFAPGTPQLLFDKPFTPQAIPLGTSGIHPDGQRFLLLQPVDRGTSISHLNLVLNWADELKRLTK